MRAGNFVRHRSFALALATACALGLLAGLVGVPRSLLFGVLAACAGVAALVLGSIDFRRTLPLTGCLLMMGASPAKPGTRELTAAELAQRDLRLRMGAGPQLDGVTYRLNGPFVEFDLAEEEGRCQVLGSPPDFIATVDDQPMKVTPGGPEPRTWTSDMFSSGDSRAASWGCQPSGSFAFEGASAEPRSPSWSRLALKDSTGELFAEIGDFWVPRNLSVTSGIYGEDRELKVLWSSPRDTLEQAWLDDRSGRWKVPLAVERLDTQGGWRLRGTEFPQRSPTVPDRAILHVRFVPVLGRCNARSCVWATPVSMEATAMVEIGSHSEVPSKPTTLDNQTLLRIFGDTSRSFDERQAALDEIGVRKVWAALPMLSKLAVLPQRPDSTADTSFRIRALVTLFEIGDHSAGPIAQRVITQAGAGAGSPGDALLRQLGALKDPASLEILLSALDSTNFDTVQSAVFGLASRPEPHAEYRLADKMIDPKTRPELAGALRALLGERASPTVLHAFFRWAVSRPDLRSGIGATLCGLLDKHRDQTSRITLDLTRDPDPNVARLAARFFDRSPGASSCVLTDAPPQGEPLDGSAYVQVLEAWSEPRMSGPPTTAPLGNNVFVRIRAKSKVYPFAFGFSTVQRPPGPYAAGMGQPAETITTAFSRLATDSSSARWHGAAIERGEVTLISTQQRGQPFALTDVLAPSVVSRSLQRDEGELLFFVGENKYRIDFRFRPPKVPSGPPPPVP